MKSINEEYIEDYIRGLLPAREDYLKDLEAYAEVNHVPIVEPEVAQLLRVLIRVHKPKKILEIGTAIGYSALVMAATGGENCHITTIERRPDMIEKAEKNIGKTPYKDRIKILEGDAEEVLLSLEERYDFIFLDAAKGQYMDFFNKALKLLDKNGLIVSDNVLYKGMVATDELVIRRKKTIVKRLRAFLKYINEIEGVTSSIIPIGDGLALTYRDAGYLGGEAFGLRQASKNFSIDQIEEGINYAHQRGKKVYITLNIVPHDKDMEGLEEYVKELYRIKADALIVADLGMYSVIKRSVPDMEIHISTQASVTNYETMMFWYDLGVRRVVPARELSLEELRSLTERLPKDMELETFVHGAMCMSYSGRCLISNYMTGRDANLGDCAQPCRYKYHLVEEKRPGEFFPVFEDEEGTFIMNSKDLCMIDHIPDLVKAGIKSFKIEGRVKSAYYVATVIRAYRMAIDEYYKDPENYVFDEKWMKEIKKASHRDFTKGFYFGKPTDEAQVYNTSSYIRGYDFLGLVLDYDEESQIATIEQRNRMFVGEEIEVFGPGKDFFTQKIEKMWDSEANPIEVAPHAQQIIKIKMDQKVAKMDIIRKEVED